MYSKFLTIVFVWWSQSGKGQIHDISQEIRDFISRFPGSEKFYPTLRLTESNKGVLESQEANYVLMKYIGEPDDEILTQFFLDCSQFPEVILLKKSGKFDIVDRLFYVCQSWCYLVRISRNKKCSEMAMVYILRRISIHDYSKSLLFVCKPWNIAKHRPNSRFSWAELAIFSANPATHPTENFPKMS